MTYSLGLQNEVTSTISDFVSVSSAYNAFCKMSYCSGVSAIYLTSSCFTSSWSLDFWDCFSLK